MAKKYRVLKDRSIPDKEKKDWVAMAEKAEFRLDAPQTIKTYNIGSIRSIIAQNAGISIEGSTDDDTAIVPAGSKMVTVKPYKPEEDEGEE
jgi:hypothetical protein